MPLTHVREHGTYDLDKILLSAKELPYHLVHVSQFKDFVYSDILWSEYHHKMISPYDILHGKIVDKSGYLCRIMASSNMEEPVIISEVIRPNNPPFYINEKLMFGMFEIKGFYDVIYGIFHLLHRIFVKKAEYLLVKYVPFSLIHEYRIKSLYTKDENGHYIIEIDSILNM